jgi:hypothetical protein
MTTYLEAIRNQEIHADSLVGEKAIVSAAITLEGAEALPRGAVLGLVSTTAHYRLAAATATDGSAVPCAVLAVPADPKGGTVTAWAYFKGAFNAPALRFDDSFTLPTLIEAMHNARMLVLS